MYRITTIILLGILSVTLLSGCSTRLDLRYQKAPDINLAAIERISVSDFSVTSDFSLDLKSDDFDEMIVDGVVDTVFEVLGLSSEKHIQETIENNHDVIASNYQNQLKEIIAKDGYLDVANDDLYEAILTGNILYKLSLGDLDETNYKDKNGKENTYYKLNSHADVTVTFEILNKQEGLIGSAVVEAHVSKEFSGDSDDGSTERSIVSSATDIKELETLLNKALMITLELVLNKVTPHEVVEKRKLMFGLSNELRKGNEAAKSGDWNEAVRFWSILIDESDDYYNQVAALYNLGIIAEIKGDLEIALERYEEALEYFPLMDKLTKWRADYSEFKTASERVRGRIENRIKLEEITSVRK